MEEKKEQLENEQTNKPTYEKLEEIAQKAVENLNIVNMQNAQLMAKIRELSEFAAFKRLDYLFKVIEFAELFNSEFITKCINEIETTMTIVESENTEENGEQN